MCLGSYGTGNYGNGVFGRSVDRVLQLHDELYNWKSPPIDVMVATSIDNDELLKINVVDTLETGKFKPREPSDENVYWLPKKFNEGGGRDDDSKKW